MLTRRDFNKLAAATVLLPSLAGCSSSSSAASGSRVILYCSLDREAIEPTLLSVAKSAGIEIDLVTDTEATKTTGLVQRLLDEKPRPRADLWMSSEVVGTARLSREGVLAPLPATITAADAWPREHVSPNRDWAQFSLRPRQVVFNTRQAKQDEMPRTLADFALPRWRGRVVIAKPQFGTTRGHMASLLTTLGEQGYRDLIGAWKSADVRLVDGNAAVVRAVARGEAHLGLTDCDDTLAGLREHWPLDYARNVRETDLPATPSSIALVRGGPNPAAAAKLAEALLLGGEMEKALANFQPGGWGGIPVSSRAGVKFDDPQRAWCPDWSTVALRVEDAMRVWAEIW